MTRSATAGLYGSCMLAFFEKLPKSFPEWMYHCTFLQASYEWFSFSSFLLEFDLVTLCNFSHLVGMLWYFTIVLISFPVMNGIACTLPTHNSYVKFLASSTSECDCIWWRTFKVITEVIWAQIQSHWCPCKKRKFGHKETPGPERTYRWPVGTWKDAQPC